MIESFDAQTQEAIVIDLDAAWYKAREFIR
jgi:hypothetical protein